jgi:hypothetical protein
VFCEPRLHLTANEFVEQINYIVVRMTRKDIVSIFHKFKYDNGVSNKSKSVTFLDMLLFVPNKTLIQKDPAVSYLQ